jgi:hypothetical protein
VLGVEKYELLAKQAGNEDPFFLKSFTRGLVSKFLSSLLLFSSRLSAVYFLSANQLYFYFSAVLRIRNPVPF